MSTDTRPSVGRRVVWVNRPSADTIGRYVGRHSADTAADMLRSTVGGVSVDCRCYRSIVNCCFAEIAAVSLPTGDAKEESIAYARVLIERGCSSNCRHFEYICYATWGLVKHWVGKKGLTRKYPGVSNRWKKQSIDRYQSIKLVNWYRWYRSIDDHRKAFHRFLLIDKSYSALNVLRNQNKAKKRPNLPWSQRLSFILYWEILQRKPLFYIFFFIGTKLWEVCYYATEQSNLNLWLKHNKRYSGELPWKKLHSHSKQCSSKPEKSHLVL